MFPDSCPGTSKYLEVHYACVSAKNPGSSNARKVPPWMRKGGGGSKVNNLLNTGEVAYSDTGYSDTV